MWIYRTLSLILRQSLSVALFACALHAQEKKGDPSPSVSPKQEPDAIQFTQLAAPFELDETEQERLDAIVQKWEARSLPIRSFSCEFTRWQYDCFSGANEPRIVQGVIKYQWPNKACYYTDETSRERWERNGEAVYEFNYSRKVIYERRLSADAHEREIESWPLPFLYRVRVDDLKRDYWIRISPEKCRKGEIRLEFHPRRQPDGFWVALALALDDIESGRTPVRFQRLDVLLNEQTMAPVGLRIEQSNGGHTSLAFSKIETNSETRDASLPRILCEFSPRLAPGWKKIVQPASQVQAE